MRRFLSPKIRSEVILTFILLFFSLVGYVPTWPYMLSNTILILLPLYIIIILNRIRFSNNSIVFICVWLIISIIPFIVNTSYIFDKDITQKIIVSSLKISGAIFAFFIGYTNKLSYKELSRILFIILLINFIFMSIQFFIMEPVIMSKNSEWVAVVQPKVFWKRQVVGICGNANTVGSFVLIVTIFIVDWLKNNKKLLWITLILSIIAIGIYAKSRNNILVSILFLGYYLLFIQKKLNPFLNYFILTFVFIAIIFISSGNEITDSVFRFSAFKDKINSLSVRLMVNKEAINVWWNHLFLFGGGVGTEPFSMKKFHSMRFYSEMLYTKFLLEMGIAGVIFSLTFLYTIFKRKIKGAFKNEKFKAILFIVIFVSFFETVFYTQQLFYFLIFIVAWLANYNTERDPYLEGTT